MLKVIARRFCDPNKPPLPSTKPNANICSRIPVQRFASRASALMGTDTLGWNWHVLLRT
jgi:hypothetical protein